MKNFVCLLAFLLTGLVGLPAKADCAAFFSKFIYLPVAHCQMSPYVQYEVSVAGSTIWGATSLPTQTGRMFYAAGQLVQAAGGGRFYLPPFNEDRIEYYESGPLNSWPYLPTQKFATFPLILTASGKVFVKEAPSSFYTQLTSVQCVNGVVTGIGPNPDTFDADAIYTISIRPIPEIC